MTKKKISFLREGIYVGLTRRRGRGVFTAVKIAAGTLVETAPVIVLTTEERKLIDDTVLYNYIFEWGPQSKQACMALGYVPLYNHSYQSNCEYEMEFEKEIMHIKAVRDIEAGEELFINYNGTWNDDRPIWFEAI